MRHVFLAFAILGCGEQAEPPSPETPGATSRADVPLPPIAVTPAPLGDARSAVVAPVPASVPAPIDVLAALKLWVPPDLRKLAGTKWLVFEKNDWSAQVAFCVAADGTVDDVRVRTSRGLDDAAVRQLVLRSVGRWRFDPAAAGRCDEVLIEATVDARTFTIEGPPGRRATGRHDLWQKQRTRGSIRSDVAAPRL